jgi:hypothetical protein
MNAQLLDRYWREVLADWLKGDHKRAEDGMRQLALFEAAYVAAMVASQLAPQSRTAADFFGWLQNLALADPAKGASS